MSRKILTLNLPNIELRIRVLRAGPTACRSALLFLLVPLSMLRAQQTIFNVPSHDVPDAGHFVGEGYFYFYTTQFASLRMTPRVMFGMAKHMELGLALQDISLIEPHEESLLIAMKRVDTVLSSPPLSISEGMSLASAFQDLKSLGAMVYSSLALSPCGALRITAGGFGATEFFTGMGWQGGAMAGIEYHMLPWLDIDADALSGNSDLGYVSVGFVVATCKDRLYLFAAFQRANAGRSGDDVLSGVTYDF